MNSRLRAALLNEGGKIDEPPLKKPRKVKNKAESAEAAGAESTADCEAAGSADGEASNFGDQKWAPRGEKIQPARWPADVTWN